MARANPLRGIAEMTLDGRHITLTPSFQNILAWEAEAGSLMLLAGRAAEGDIRLGDIVPALRACGEGLDEDLLAALVERAGLSALLEPYRMLLAAALAGRSPDAPGKAPAWEARG